MDRRRLLLILAVFVAIIGTGLVFLYVQGANKRAADKYANVTVLKATQNIASGESYDSALAAGKMSFQPVPKNQLIAGYQTSNTALKGEYAATSVFAGQQIIASQFSASASISAASPLPIPKGMIAISVNLSDPDRVAGNILDGSHVVIFVTGAGGPEKALPPSGAGGATGSGSNETATLLKNVLVLNVGSPVPVTSTTTDTTGTATTETLPRTLLTLALSQKDAQKVIMASKSATLTFGLLTPTSQIAQHLPGATDQNLFK